tara:strand:- start:10196 stop:10915 length:720 start_codon:yes stop_codon:yes gene_type:complete
MSKRLRAAQHGPYSYLGDGWELTERDDSTYVETDKITADTDGITFHIHSANTVLGLDATKKTKSLIGTDICTSSDGSVTVTNSSGKANLSVPVVTSNNSLHAKSWITNKMDTGASENISFGNGATNFYEYTNLVHIVAYDVNTSTGDYLGGMVGSAWGYFFVSSSAAVNPLSAGAAGPGILNELASGADCSFLLGASTGLSTKLKIYVPSGGGNYVTVAWVDTTPRSVKLHITAWKMQP